MAGTGTKEVPCKHIEELLHFQRNTGTGCPERSFFRDIRDTSGQLLVQSIVGKLF